MSILVVDDSEIARNRIKEILDQMGEMGLYAENGEIGYNLFLQHQKDISVIITDINMPKSNGLDMVTKIYKIADCNPPPIIVATTEISNKLKKAMKDNGAKAWVIKPFDSQKLSVLIKKIKERLT